MSVSTKPKRVEIIVYKDTADKPLFADYFVRPYRRETLHAVCSNYAENLGSKEILVNREVVAHDLLLSTNVIPGDKIEITPRPGFIFQAIGWIASTIWASAPSLLLSMAFSYLGGMLFQQNLPESDGKQGTGEQSFGFDTANTQVEGIPIAEEYGENIRYGNIASRWTNIDENGDEQLYLKIVHCEGPTSGVDLQKVYINNQPVGNFADVTVTQNLGTDDQTAMAGFEVDKVEIRDNAEITSADGAQTFNLPRSGFDEIEFTLGFDRGIYHYDKTGDQESSYVGAKVEIAVVGSGSWTTLVNENVIRNQLAPYYKEYSTEDSSISFTINRSSHYQLRVTKTSTDRNKSRYGDEVRLRSYRGVIDVAFNHPGIAMIGIIAKASDRLQGAVQVKCVREGKILRVYNGTSWNWEYSNLRAWVVYNMLTQPSVTGNGSSIAYDVEFYELFQPSSMNTAFFYEWAQLCATLVDDGDGGTTEILPCNIMINQSSELWKTCFQIASIGRARLYWDGLELTGWLDQAWDGDYEIITDQNILADSWLQEWTQPINRAGTCVIDYEDADRGYKRIKWPISNSSAGNYTNKIDIMGLGIKKRALATRVAAFALGRNQLINEFNTFAMYKDALLYELGGVYKIQRTKPNWGKSYLVLESDDSSGSELTLDRDASTDDIGNKIYIRSYVPSSGQVLTHDYTITGITGPLISIAPASLSYDVSYRDIVTIGAETDFVIRRIINKQWNSDHTYTIAVENYAPDLFDIDSVAPTVDYPEYTPAHTENKLAEPSSLFNVQTMIANALPQQPSSDIPWTSNLTWDHTGSSGTATWEATDGTNPIYFRFKDTTYNITADSTDKEFIYWDPDFTTIFRTTDDINEAIASGNWLMAVNDNDNGVVHPANGMQLIHAGVLLAGTIRASAYAELRQTMAWNGNDSGDAAHPVTLDFKIPSETTDIISVKLSFKIRDFRAYSTSDAEEASLTMQSFAGPVLTVSTNISGLTSYAAPNNPHNHSIASSHTHPTTDLGHTHIMLAHTHGLVFGIYEESNSITLHYNVDDGSGYGSSSGDYTGDQIDIDITSLISGTGWKSVRFTVDDLCRITAIVEVKVDITA